MSANRNVSGSTLAAASFAATPSRARAAWFPGLLHLGLAGIVLAEVVLVRGHFDTDRFLGDPSGFARILLATRSAAPIGIATLAALVLVGWPALVREYRWLASGPQRLARSASAVLVHVLVFLLFYRLTRSLFGIRETERLARSVVGFGSLAWGLGALAVPVSAACIAFPAGALVASARRLLPTILLATGIGVFAFALSRFVLDSGLWFPLQVATTRLARGLLWLATGESGAGEERFVLRSGDFHVLVTSFCSGFEGVALITTFLSAYFLWFRHSLRFPHVLVLLPAAALLLWILNGVRLAALVWIGDRVSPAIALEGFHSYAGWVAFCGLSLGVVHASRRIPWFVRATEAGVGLAAGATGNRFSGAGEARAETVNPAAVYLGPFLAILAVSFVSGAFSSGFDRAYPLRVLAGLAVLVFVRGELPRASRSVPWTGIAYGVAAFLLWIAVAGPGSDAPASLRSGLAELPPWAARGWLAFRALGFLLVAPLAEELAFRGFLARRLVRADFESLAYRSVTPFAWCVSSLAFGLLHDQWLAATLTGALFGLAAIHRGRLGDALAAHVTTNALLLLSSLAFGPWLGWL